MNTPAAYLDTLAGEQNRQTEAKVYCDLVALDRGFDEAEIDLDEKTVSVTTGPITLEGLYLGRFEIVLSWDLIGEPHPYLFKALESNPSGADASVLELERTLSGICGDHASCAGLWQGRAFRYHLLRSPPPFRPSAVDAQTVRWNISQVELDRAMRHLGERIAKFRRIARAYAGWLLTNLDFLTEHDALFAKWSDMVRRWAWSVWECFS